MHLTTTATIFCYLTINPESPGTASSSANRGRHFSKCFKENVLDTLPFSDRHLIGTSKLNILCLKGLGQAILGNFSIDQIVIELTEIKRHDLIFSC